MSVVEKSIKSDVKRVIITGERELARRERLQAARREILALNKERQEFERKFQSRMLALSQEIYELTNDIPGQ